MTQQPQPGLENNGYPPDQTPSEEGPRNLWVYKLGALLFAILCFELGAFLLVFPWLENWDSNLILSLWPSLRPVWMSPYFRGALSGVGLLNFYISATEILSLRRFARPAGQSQTGVDSVE